MAKVLTSVRTPLEKRYLIVFLGRVPHRQSPNFSWIIASCLQAVRLILLVAKLPLTFSALLRRSLVSLGQPTQNPLYKVQSLRLYGKGTHFRSYASRKTILNRFSRQSATSAKSKFFLDYCFMPSSRSLNFACCKIAAHFFGTTSAFPRFTRSAYAKSAFNVQSLRLYGEVQCSNNKVQL